MKIDKIKAKGIVIEVIYKILDNKVKITEDMALIGGASLLDSMKLVELCIALEDRAEELGFEFDWTSESTMSKSRSMFRTIATISDEFARQSEV
jgi:acyl carrier protein